ncbi:Orotate phosphoribosyltransferase [Mariniradius saccharolyticus AK6]|uniref:Orotate phosphoribosyltransferase n=1 Tax=Mariniradius saccharolyticus AK6 TaxID=1239962 RepID=M7XYD9_9BACT|nr:orotate phosphoribosyltransferase [Mariniradius saccharolyticus]EMS33502.1 Orotate phosphoribosyltransferase [Mariniradius saccharolyticus AK6]
MKIFDPKIASAVAQRLLEIEAIRLQPTKPFTWASGWKSPIYCDNRLSLSYPAVRSFIKHYLQDAIQKNFANIEAVAGVATAGIPQGALLADAMNLPFLYVRSSPKGHGMENMIEGKVTPGQKVVVVEDLVSTGGSSLKAVTDLKAAGFEVLGMVAIFTYGFELAAENFEKAGVELVCLSDYSSMLPQAIANNYIDQNTLASLQEWRKNPGAWGK